MVWWEAAMPVVSMLHVYMIYVVTSQARWKHQYMLDELHYHLLMCIFQNLMVHQTMKMIRNGHLYPRVSITEHNENTFYKRYADVVTLRSRS